MSIISKLKLKQEQPFWLINAPVSVSSLFEEIEVKTAIARAASVAQVLIFAKDKAELTLQVNHILAKLLPDALLWIAYPKKSGKIKSDITRDNGWEDIFAAGYEPVMQIAIDEDWSALRFRSADAIKDKIRDIPMAERNTEGIDYINRTTTLPADAADALDAHKALRSFFEGLPFSHRKEYIQAIVEAKKPETRQRRIEKMIEALLEMRTQKEKKKK